MTNQLSLSNVINVAVQSTPTGVSAFNTANLAMFTADSAATTFGTAGYKIYFEPTSIGVDFGTDSATFKMAVAVFSQQPNILAAGGYLVIITLQSSETLDAAITRTLTLVQYTGIMSAAIESQADMLAAAAVIQANPALVGFFAQHTSSDIDTGGSLDLLRSGGLTQSRGLIYDDATSTNALIMQAAYAGRALSTNFNGSNTVGTMHLKTLPTVQPDPGLTQTLLNKAIAAGADSYVSIQGVPAVFCSGENTFFDQVLNQVWIAGALQVAGFNFLQGASTKIPQTEAGMDALKGAYRTVCEQSVTNGMTAPGLWTSPTTFGNQVDFLANISQYGYYIYSQPVAQQLQSAREARQATVVQIAIKLAGALHSSNVIVNLNA